MTQLNIVAFNADADSDPEHYPPPSGETVQKVTVEEVLAAYDGWGPEVRNLLGCAENPTKWTINVVYPHISAEKWVRGRVTILGDAAHGMLPHLGAGAGQGLEDAYVLGKLLGHPQTTLENVEVRFRANFVAEAADCLKGCLEGVRLGAPASGAKGLGIKQACRGYV